MSDTEACDSELPETAFDDVPPTDDEWEQLVRDLYNLIPGHKMYGGEVYNKAIVLDAIQDAIEHYYLEQKRIRLRKWSDHESPILPSTPRRSDSH